MVMQDFQSNALNRTFDEVVFISAVHQGTDAAPTVTRLEPESNSGTVLSTENAAGYIYIELETDAGETLWLAAPETEVAVADRVAWRGGSIMVNFESRSLDRTFPEILFVGGVSIGE
jgi:hypothetical protein